MPIIDHTSKLVVGYRVTETADTELALASWEKAKATLKGFGHKLHNVIIHHDQDGVYRGHGWLYQVMVKDNLRVSLLEDGAKENVHIEAFNGRFKEENRLLFWEQEDLESLRNVIDQRIRYYNQVRRHSALDNKSPVQYLREKGKIPGGGRNIVNPAPSADGAIPLITLGALIHTLGPKGERTMSLDDIFIRPVREEDL